MITIRHTIFKPFGTSRAILLFIFSLFTGVLYGQSDKDTLQSSPINVSKRKKVFWSVGAGGYLATSYVLYNAWYKEYEQDRFHFFDDRGEWYNIDKFGHTYGAFVQASSVYDVAQWTGFDPSQSLKIATLSSLIGQSTVEIMDGFSADWGFSISDIGANLIGTSLFFFQQKHWRRQRIRMKMSYIPIDYGRHNNPALEKRIDNLFGSNPLARFVKDYNAQTIWLSSSPADWWSSYRGPKWLGLAIGISGHNLYGGYANRWQASDTTVDLSKDYVRGYQIILAIDYDLSKVSAISQFGKSLLKVLNYFKWPAPGISYTSSEGVQLHLFYMY